MNTVAYSRYSKHKQPVAFLTWAVLEEGVELDREALSGDDLKIWRSGEKLTVVDCISPFNPGERFVEMLMGEVDTGNGQA